MYFSVEGVVSLALSLLSSLADVAGAPLSRLESGAGRVDAGRAGRIASWKLRARDATSGWLRVHARGRGLRRTAPLAPPCNSKYRPVKAIPARRLNRPTNPLVDAPRQPRQKPPSDLLIHSSFSRSFESRPLFAGWRYSQRRKYRYTSPVPVTAYFWRGHSSPRCYMSVG